MSKLNIKELNEYETDINELNELKYNLDLIVKTTHNLHKILLRKKRNSNFYVITIEVDCDIEEYEIPHVFLKIWRKLVKFKVYFSQIKIKWV